MKIMVIFKMNNLNVCVWNSFGVKKRLCLCNFNEDKIKFFYNIYNKKIVNFGTKLIISPINLL